MEPLPKYKCTVYKCEYYLTVIEVEACGAADAAFKAENEAKHGEHVWIMEDRDYDCMTSDVTELMEGRLTELDGISLINADPSDAAQGGTHGDKAQRDLITAFLREADNRIDAFPGRIPFEPKVGHLVVAWLRGRIGEEK